MRKWAAYFVSRRGDLDDRRVGRTGAPAGRQHRNRIAETGYGKGREGELLSGIRFPLSDIRKFYFPIVTCLLISAVFSLLAWLFRR